jgi:hypothetical protein
VSNCLIAYRNFADFAALSGGSWSATMPLANLLDRTLGVKARAVDDAAASTQFDVDLGSAAGIKVFCLAGHNLSVGALMRLRGSDTAGTFTTPLYDSGTVSAWGNAYTTSDIPWEDDAFWASVTTFTGLDAGNPTLIHILPAETAARYWRLEITDTTNADGYVEAGRLFLGQAWQPTYNFTYGAGIAYADDSIVEQALGGSEYFDARPVRRIISLRFDALTDAEAMQMMLDMQRLRGTTGEILFCWDPDDLSYFQQRSMLCRQAELNPIELARLGAHAAALKLRELI